MSMNHESIEGASLAQSYNDAEHAGLWQRVAHSRIGRIALGVVLAAAAGGLYAEYGGESSSTNIAAAAGAPAPSQGGTIEQLAVNQPDVSCVAIVKEFISEGGTGAIQTVGSQQVVRPHIYALDGTTTSFPPGDRLKSTNMEGPLLYPNSTTNSTLQIEATVCEDPLFGVTLSNMLANTEINGVEIPTADPWLNPYQFSAASPINNIETKAASFFDNASDFSNTASNNLRQTLAQNERYNQLAEKLNTLLNRFSAIGRNTEETTLNYHLSLGGAVTGIPQVSLNGRQYLADAEMFELTRKTGGCDGPTIGFNVEDMRPEEFSGCVIVTGPTPTSSTTPGKSITPPSTTFIGPKHNAHPPVPGGEPTTIGPDNPGPSVPTTSTTTPPTTETTIPPNTTTSTTNPSGGCGSNCP